MQRLLAEHGVRRVVHLGAHAGVRASIAEPLDVRREQRPRHARRCWKRRAAAPVERFVLVSSSTVYGAGRPCRFSEDAPLGIPLSPYGVDQAGGRAAGADLSSAARRAGGVPAAVQRLWPADATRPGDVDLRRGDRRRPPHSAIWRRFGIAAISRTSATFAADCWRRSTPRTWSARRSTWAITSRLPMRELIALLEAALGARPSIDRRPASPADMPLTCADLTKAAAAARLSAARCAGRRRARIRGLVSPGSRHVTRLQSQRPVEETGCRRAGYFSPISFATFGSIDSAQIS